MERRKCSPALKKSVALSKTKRGGFDISVNFIGAIPVLALKKDKFHFVEWLGTVGTISIDGQKYELSGYAKFFAKIPKHQQSPRRHFVFESDLPAPQPLPDHHPSPLYHHHYHD